MTATLATRSGGVSVRFVPLSRELLSWALAEERDPVTAREIDQTGAADLMCDGSVAGQVMLGRGHVLAAAGLVLQLPGVARAWILVSRHTTPRECVFAVRLAERTIAALLAAGSVRRIEMTVRDGQPWRESFARALGMRCEGLMRAFSPAGDDHWLYARVGEKP